MVSHDVSLSASEKEQFKGYVVEETESLELFEMYRQIEE